MPKYPIVKHFNSRNIVEVNPRQYNLKTTRGNHSVDTSLKAKQ